MSDSIKYCTVALECQNAGELARFYAEITDGRVTYADAQWPR